VNDEGVKMKPCGRKEETKSKWGPVQVDRPRRTKNTGGTVMQKAMELGYIQREQSKESKQ
jgi:hypothetical protein